MNEKKNLILFFGDIKGFTTFCEGKKTEEISLILKEIYKICEEEIKKNNGKIISYIGDAILAVFGYPEASLEDFKRPFFTALQINERLKRTFPLLMKFSIHFDEVEVSIDELGEFSIFGNGVDFVKEINKFSSPENMVVSENIFKLLKNEYLFIGPEEINIYGKRNYIYKINIKELKDKNNYFKSLIDTEEKKKKFYEIYETSLNIEETFEAGIGLAYLLIREGKFYSAYKIIEDLKKEVMDESLEKVRLLNCLAWLYYANGKLEESKIQIQNSFRIYEEIDKDYKNLDILLNILNIQGLISYREGDYLKAKDFYVYGIKKGKKINSLIPFLTNLGNVYFQMGEFLKSESCHRYSYKLKKETKKYKDLPATCISYSNLLIEMGNLNKAKNLLEEAKRIIDDYSLEFLEIYYYYTLGNLLFLQENEGIEEYQKALSICSKIDNNFPVPMILSGIAIYNSYNLKDREKTFKIIEKAISLSEEHKNFEYYLFSNLALLYASIRFEEKYDEKSFEILKIIKEKKHFRFLPEISRMIRVKEDLRKNNIFKYKKNLIVKI